LEVQKALDLKIL
jgi:hypothetical protein